MKKCFQLNNQTHQFKKCKRLFKVKKRDSYKLSLNITQNISISTTSISGNFQILNTKVCVDEEILKTTNAPKWMQKERSHNQWTNEKPKAKTNLFWKLKNFSKLKCNLIKKKWTFSFNFANELRERNKCNYWSLSLQTSKWSEQASWKKAHRGRSANFEEITSKKFGLPRSTRALHRQPALSTQVRWL